MARKSLRPDWRTYAFTYDVDIDPRHLPDTVWRAARAMQTLWNGLVARHEVLQASYSTETPKEEKYAAYDLFTKAGGVGYEYIKNEGDALGLTCWLKWEIMDRFKASVKRWTQALAQRNFDIGPPSVQHGLNRISFPYRTQTGGVKPEWLGSIGNKYGDSKPLLLPTTEGPHNGYFEVLGQRVPFKTVIHRPLPPDCIVKRVTLTGRHERPFGYSWQIVVSLQTPPVAIVAPLTRRTVAIDWGWRVRPEGVRVGVLFDGKSERELVLPFDLANRQERRLRERLVERGESIELTRRLQDVWELQSHRDKLVEETKQILRDLPRQHWPEEARLVLHGYEKLRFGGLLKIRRLLCAALPTETDAACRLLNHWPEADYLLAAGLTQARLRTMATRREIYRTWAAWLAANVDVLAWEDELNLAEMAQSKKKRIKRNKKAADAAVLPDTVEPQPVKRLTKEERALDLGQKYRNYANLYLLKTCLKQAFAEAGKTIVAVPAAGTTSLCYFCQAPIAVSSELVLECAHGHRQDQDRNAARNIFARLDPSLRAVTEVLPAANHSLLKRFMQPLNEAITAIK